jgi:hypothetical protein
MAQPIADVLTFILGTVIVTGILKKFGGLINER